MDPISTPPRSQGKEDADDFNTPNSRRSFTTSEADSSVVNYWFIVYLPAKGKDQAYQIVGSDDIVADSWTILEKGAKVDVKDGDRIIPGEVVCVTDELEYCKSHYYQIIMTHRQDTEDNARGEVDEPLEKKRKLSPSASSTSETSPNTSTSTVKSQQSANSTPQQIWCVQRDVVKVRDQETQTNIDMDYEELKRKYKEVCTVAQKFQDIFDEVSHNMNESLSRFNLIKADSDSLPSTSTTNKSMMDRNFMIDDEDKENYDSMVVIGAHGTKVTRRVYNSINWTSHTLAVRTLLSSLFTREDLASRSLTGKPSPAFVKSGKKVKQQLDPKIIDDIIEIVVRKSNVPEQMVRQAITTKCADENKMLRRKKTMK